MALEFGYSIYDVEKEPPIGHGGIDGLLEGNEAQFGGGDGFNALLKVKEVSAEAIQPPNHQRVAHPREVERLRQTRLGESRAAHAVVGEDALASRLGECIGLKGKVLVLGRDAGVTNEHVGNLNPQLRVFDRNLFYEAGNPRAKPIRIERCNRRGEGAFDSESVVENRYLSDSVEPAGIRGSDLAAAARQPH